MLPDVGYRLIRSTVLKFQDIPMNQIDRLLGIMQRLRDPENGCPWDKE